MRSTAFLACAAIVACSRSDRSATEEPASTTTITSAPVASEAPEDDELIQRAEAALSATPGLSKTAGAIEVDVTEGVATLRGATPDPAIRRASEEAVASVPGIVTTLNKVELRAPTRDESDDTMAFSLQRALLNDPAMASEAELVTIEVRNGSVTLRGTLSEPQTREAAELIAERTPGIVGVRNLLSATPRQ